MGIANQALGFAARGGRAARKGAKQGYTAARRHKGKVAIGAGAIGAGAGTAALIAKSAKSRESLQKSLNTKIAAYAKSHNISVTAAKKRVQAARSKKQSLKASSLTP